MRPVISARASACAAASRPSFGTVNHIVAENSTIHSRNGASSQASNCHSTTELVRKYTAT